MRYSQTLKRNLTPYEEWLEDEELLVVGGSCISDVLTQPLRYWPRQGGNVARVNFPLNRQFIDACICEIPPRSELKPQKHLFEEVILVVSGYGATSVWNEGPAKQTFEWGPYSLFAIPLNAWHQHFNPTENPARYLAVTTLPSMMNAFHNQEFIFQNSFVFQDRYSVESDYFSARGKYVDKPDVGSKLQIGQVLVSNFIPDVSKVQLVDFSARGGTNVGFQFAGNVLTCHTSMFPSGTYKKAHRHPQIPGFIGFTLKGAGYSLVWDGSLKRSDAPVRERVDWQPNCLWTYECQNIHQHFNLSPKPAQYLAFFLGSHDYPGFGGYLDRRSTYVGLSQGGHNIEWEREDPLILEMFQRELAKYGRRPKDLGTWRI